MKELRLQRISSEKAANAFALAFMTDYNRRFGRAPLNSHDAHRPLLASEDLQRIFTWQEQRTLTSNLVVHFKRKSYLVKPSPETIALAADGCWSSSTRTGEVELRHGDTALPLCDFRQEPSRDPGSHRREQAPGRSARARPGDSGNAGRETARIKSADRSRKGSPACPSP